MSKPETCDELTRIEADNTQLIVDDPLTGPEVNPGEIPESGTITAEYQLSGAMKDHLIDSIRRSTPNLLHLLRSPFFDFEIEGDDDA